MISATSSSSDKTFITQIREVRDLQYQHYSKISTAQRQIEEKRIEWQNKVSELVSNPPSLEPLDSYLEKELNTYLDFSKTAVLAKDILERSAQVIAICTRSPLSETDYETLAGLGVERNKLNHKKKNH